MTGRLQVQGDLARVLEALYRLSAPIPSWRDRLRARLAPAITPSTAHRNTHHHYDLGNDFYRLWLDGQMVYTCAYFPDATTSLDDAQRPNSIWSAASCSCGLASACSRPEAAGARWRSTWHGTTGSPSRRTTCRANR